MPTPYFLNFDIDELDCDETRVADALAEQPANYVNHLMIAQHLDARAEQAAQDEARAETQGYIKAMREIAADLRQGDFLPGGALVQDPRDPNRRFKGR